MLIVATKYLFAKNVHLIIWRLNYSKVFKIFFLPTIKYSFANNIDVLLLARPFKYLSGGRALVAHLWEEQPTGWNHSTNIFTNIFQYFSPIFPPLGKAPSWFGQPVNHSTNIFLRYLKYSLSNHYFSIS